MDEKTRDVPRPYDRLAVLERQAFEVVALGEPGSEAEAATLSAKRRGLLIELEHEGLLAERPPAGLSDEVREHPTLASYFEAARKLWDYYRSDEREEWVEAPAPVRLLEGVISIDWFRTPNDRPAEFGELEWTADCEDAFRCVEGEGPSRRPVERRMMDGVYLLRGRYDDGTHAVMVRTERRSAATRVEM